MRRSQGRGRRPARGLRNVESSARPPARGLRTVGSGARPPARRPGPEREGEAEKTRPLRRRSELASRVLIAIPAIALALFLVISGGLIFTVGLFLIGLLCLHELFTMYERVHPVRLAGVIGLAAMLLTAQYGERSQLLLVAVAMLPVVFGLSLLLRSPNALGLAVTLLGLWWIGFGFAHAILLRAEPHGLGVVIDVLLGTFIGDTGAYFGGRLFGSRPLAPSISPNKTVEGLLIGALAAVGAVWIASTYESWMPAAHALVLGAGVAVLGPAGDLFESFLKREAGAKDAGRAFGAHGGALDRLDAVLFTVVVGYYIWAAYV